MSAAQCRDGLKNTLSVGSFKPNAFGVYDMLGNAWQWVLDYHNPDFSQVPTNGSAFEAPACSSRGVRGGSWLYQPRHLRAGLRNWAAPGHRNYGAGFRVARTFTP